MSWRAIAVRVTAVLLLAVQAQPAAAAFACDRARHQAAESCEGMAGDRPEGAVLASGSSGAMPLCAVTGPCAQPAAALIADASAALTVSEPAPLPARALVAPLSFDPSPTSPPPQA
jgi:hypothetical protein